ncbi:hypothetical protein VTN02DRAFT_3862 [Thermoascus thermophilus]
MLPWLMLSVRPDESFISINCPRQSCWGEVTDVALDVTTAVEAPRAVNEAVYHTSLSDRRFSASSRYLGVELISGEQFGSSTGTVEPFPWLNHSGPLTDLGWPLAPPCRAAGKEAFEKSHDPHISSSVPDCWSRYQHAGPYPM